MVADAGYDGMSDLGAGDVAQAREVQPIMAWVDPAHCGFSKDSRKPGDADHVRILHRLSMSSVR